MGVLTNIIKNIAGKDNGSEAPYVEPRSNHPAGEFVNDVTDAHTICFEGRFFLWEKMGKGGYDRYVARHTRGERDYLKRYKGTIGYRPEGYSLEDTLSGMRVALVVAEIYARRLVKYDRAEMTPSLREAVDRFIARLPKAAGGEAA